ncbi:MAG: dihydrofolate reductase family protein, partial [Chloroflexota bacterium]
MSKVVLGMAMSLDGFVQDKNGSVGKLYPDLGALDNTDMLQESIRETGAVVMGRRAYDMANGDFTGYEYQVPIFVVTHHPPEQVAKGENGAFKFNFVTDGVERAVAQAKAAAGERDVTIIGGADIAQQVIRAGLADELDMGIAPILFGEGLRFFEHLKAEQIELETLKVT